MYKKIPFGVAKDDRLGDSQSIIQIAQSIELPFLAFDSNEELLDTFQSQFIAFDQNPDRIRHELRGHFQDLVG